MKILYVTSEAAPFCKTGGLGDVAGSLPASLAQEGGEIAVVLPLYRRVREHFGEQLYYECYDYVDLAWRHLYCGLFSLERDGVTWYFLDNEQYFDRPELYGYADDGERFAFFSRAVVRMLSRMKFWPEVVHCNDWQTALVPIYLKDDGVREDKYRSIRTAFTIHNIEYQGRFNPYVAGDLFGLDAGWVRDGTLMMDQDLNLLKGAIVSSDAVTTVSPTYANELKLAYFAHRLESVMRQCEYKLSGVLNGIDTHVFDPATDKRITHNYSAADLSGKARDKTELQQMLGLREDPGLPIVAIVSRLVSHKGLDLVCEVIHDMMGLPMQLVILGKGDQKYEEFFHWAGQQYPGRMAVRLDYNEDLSMAIYSGADLFLMPSRSEPCGLSQMIAMRYGTIPVVRETGGLRDTVQPYDALRDAGNGYSFANYSSGDMLYVLRSAVYLYTDYPDAFARLRQRAMACDFSWARSAQAYMRIYAGLLGRVWPDPEAPAEAAPAEAAPAEAAPAEAAPAEAAVEAPAKPKKPKRAKKEKELKAEEASAVEEAPKEEASAPEETPKEEKAPRAKRASAAKKAPKEEAPAVEEAPKEEAPTVEQAPKAEAVPVVEESPEAEEVSVAEEAPAEAPKAPGKTARKSAAEKTGTREKKSASDEAED